MYLAVMLQLLYDAYHATLMDSTIASASEQGSARDGRVRDY